MHSNEKKLRKLTKYMSPQQVRILAITKQNVEKEAQHLTNGTKGQRQTQRQ